jgi:HEAT repeat protein
MGLLDFLFDSEKAEQRQLQKHEETLTNMYVQESERKFAIESLADMESPEAVEVLLKRFTETCHNSTVDIDEKEYTYDVLVQMGRNADVDVVGLVVEYLRTAHEKVNWPLKVLKDLLSYEEMTEVVKELLDTCEEGYKEHPEKKQELMLQAAELKDEELAEKLVDYLDDSNETIRFLAVDAVAHQEQDEFIEEPLRERLLEENSLRVVKKIAELFSDNSDWTIPDDQQADVEKAIPDEYGIHKHGHIYKRRV